MAAQRLHEPFSHGPTRSTAAISRDPFGVALDFGDDESRTRAFHRLLRRRGKFLQRCHSAGVRDPGPSGHLRQIGFARRKRRAHVGVGTVVHDEGHEIGRVHDPPP